MTNKINLKNKFKALTLNIGNQNSIPNNVNNKLETYKFMVKNANKKFKIGNYKCKGFMKKLPIVKNKFNNYKICYKKVKASSTGFKSNSMSFKIRRIFFKEIIFS